MEKSAAAHQNLKRAHDNITDKMMRLAKKQQPFGNGDSHFNAEEEHEDDHEIKRINTGTADVIRNTIKEKNLFTDSPSPSISFESRGSSVRENITQHMPASKRTVIPNGKGVLDFNDGDQKADKLISYRGQDLTSVRLNTGDTIKDDDEEIRALQEIEKILSNKKTKKGGDVDFLHRRPVNAEVKKVQCRICEHCSATEMFENSAKMDAIKAMNLFDKRFTGVIPDLTLFQKNADVFNNYQTKLAGVGGRVHMITAREVRDHYQSHDLTNEFRPIVRQMYIYDEIINRLTSHLIGVNEDTNREVINGNKIKLITMISDRRTQLQKRFSDMRREFLMRWNSDQGGTGGGDMYGSITTGIGKTKTGKYRR